MKIQMKEVEKEEKERRLEKLKSQVWYCKNKMIFDMKLGL